MVLIDTLLGLVDSVRNDGTEEEKSGCSSSSVSELHHQLETEIVWDSLTSGARIL